MKRFAGSAAVRALSSAAGVFCLLIGMSTAAQAAVPEIDAGSLSSGLAVMAGVTLMITGRPRKRVEPAGRGSDRGVGQG